MIFSIFLSRSAPEGSRSASLVTAASVATLAEALGWRRPGWLTRLVLLLLVVALWGEI